MGRISEHISYREATRSYTALKEGIDNTPNEQQLANMKILAEKVFEPVRRHFNKPIKVESFFRSRKVNKRIGGSKNSQHLADYGAAIDIDDDFGGLINADMFYYIVQSLEFDQIIWEFGNDKRPQWIHVSYVESNNRKRISIAYKYNRKTVYKHFDDGSIEDFNKFKELLYKGDTA
jgi:zinc D-Ala-D-Ala carboxypeptidase